MKRLIKGFGSLATQTCAAVLFFISSHPVDGATLVSGNVSGEWTKTGSPYMVIDNCTVPSDQSLTIQPGTTVIIGEGLKFTVNGRFMANGSESDIITFKGTSSSNSWDKIEIFYNGKTNSELTHCRISDCDYGLFLQNHTGGTMQTKVFNSLFSNCKSACIFIKAHGSASAYGSVVPINNTQIYNCKFLNSKIGVSINIHGARNTEYFTLHEGRGSSNPQINNCIFDSISDTAVSCHIGDYPASSKPILINNVMNNCKIGVNTIDPFDINLYNSIITGCETAVTRTGTLSGQVGFTCFYNNTTNFVGYPSAYGKVVLQNQNGTPSDVAMNIFVNPAFAETANFTLAANSSCIDAGDANTNYSDKVFPPSLGTAVNDMGAYGGPGAVMPAISTNGDQDGDGIPDSWMIKYFGHASGQENDKTRAQDDYEDDGLTNAEEFEAGTDPTKADTDGDGFNDQTEIQAGSDPLDPQSTPPPQLMIRVKQVELEFIAGNGKTNVIQASSDWKTWSQVEQIMGTGNSVSRIYNVTNNMRYFRLIQP